MAIPFKTFPFTSTINGSVPAPLAAGVGLIAAGAEAARKLPLQAASLPITAATAVQRLRTTLREEYAELAHRGEATIGRLRRETSNEGPAEGTVTVEDVLDPFSLSEPVAALVDGAAPGATLTHDQLPLEDYDHLTLGSLRARIRKLDAPSLVQLRDYERAHANRLPVLVAFDNRLKTLAEGAPGATQATLVTV